MSKSECRSLWFSRSIFLWSMAPCSASSPCLMDTLNRTLGRALTHFATESGMRSCSRNSSDQITFNLRCFRFRQYVRFVRCSTPRHRKAPQFKLDMTKKIQMLRARLRTTSKVLKSAQSAICVWRILIIPHRTCARSSISAANTAAEVESPVGSQIKMVAEPL
jgi:hypothetical protein